MTKRSSFVVGKASTKPKFDWTLEIPSPFEPEMVTKKDGTLMGQADRPVILVNHVNEASNGETINFTNPADIVKDCLAFPNLKPFMKGNNPISAKDVKEGDTISFNPACKFTRSDKYVPVM